LRYKLSVLNAPGTPGNPEQKIAKNVVKKYGSIEQFGGRRLEEFYEIEGRGDAKMILLGAVLEIACRAALGILDDNKKQTCTKRGP
jgi:DNA repair protein RadC